MLCPSQHGGGREIRPRSQFVDAKPGQSRAALHALKASAPKGALPLRLPAGVAPAMRKLMVHLL